jgi:hypothetical protein
MMESWRVLGFDYICVSRSAESFKLLSPNHLNHLRIYYRLMMYLPGRVLHRANQLSRVVGSKPKTWKQLDLDSVLKQCIIGDLSNQMKKDHIYMMSSPPLYLNKGELFFESESDLSSTAATRLGKPSKDLA